MPQRGAPFGRLVEDLNDGRAARPFLLAASAAIAIFIWIETRHQTLFLDEWGFLLQRDGFTINGLLEPEYGHLLLFPLILYRGVWDLFGIDTYAPLRLALIFFDLLCSWLLFIWAERRIGSWPAAAFAALLAVLGSAWEVTATPDGVSALISIAAGLAMMLAFDVRGRRGDIWASIFLALSLYSFSTGLVFLVAAVLLLNLDRRGRWGRNWVWAVPAGIYLVWRIWASARFDDSSFFNWQNLANVPSLFVDGLGGTIASLTGLFRNPGMIGGTEFRIGVAEPLALALIVFCFYLFIKGFQIRGKAWAMIATFVAFWVSAAMVQGPARPDLATEPRYFYPGALFLIMAAAAVIGRPRRLPARAWAVAGLIFLPALIANVFQYHYAASHAGLLSSGVRADLTALDLAEGKVSPDFHPDTPPVTNEVSAVAIPILTAGSYFAHKADFGTPAFSVAQLLRQSNDLRRRTDIVLARALRLALVPAPSPPATAANPPRILAAAGVESVVKGGCQSLPAAPAGSYVVVQVPPAGLAFTAPGAPGGAAITPAAVAVGRFADTVTAPLGKVPAGSTETLVIPHDKAGVPWKALIGPTAPVRVCALAAAAPSAP